MKKDNWDEWMHNILSELKLNKEYRAQILTDLARRKISRLKLKVLAMILPGSYSWPEGV